MDNTPPGTGPAPGQDMRVLGCMSGTSVDGIDIACADLRLAGEELQVSYRGLASSPFPGDLRQRILAALPPAPASAAEICALHADLGRAYAAAFTRAHHDLAGNRADLAVLHGQTIYHWTDQNSKVLGTLQLGNPAEIAETTGIPVISDLRSRDIAAGGQGAPLVPVFDQLLLGGQAAAGPAGAVNLGGIANLTVITAGQIAAAYDLGPAGALMDLAAQRASGGSQRYDTDGVIAASGLVHAGLLGVLSADPFYQLPPPRSTGREHFNAAYLDSAIRQISPAPAPPDVAATLTRLLVDQVAAAARRYGLREILLSGGGSRNTTTTRLLRAALPGTRIRTTDQIGVPAQAKEALAFAVLGYLTWYGLPGSAPAATGARRAPVLGSITPGTGPLILPPPAAIMPAALRLTTPG